MQQGRIVEVGDYVELLPQQGLDTSLQARSCKTKLTESHWLFSHFVCYNDG